MDEKRNQPAAGHQGLNATNKKDGVWRFSIMILKILRSDGGAKVKVVKHFRESCKKTFKWTFTSKASVTQTSCWSVGREMETHEILDDMRLHRSCKQPLLSDVLLSFVKFAQIYFQTRCELTLMNQVLFHRISNNLKIISSIRLNIPRIMQFHNGKIQPAHSNSLFRVYN